MRIHFWVFIGIVLAVMPLRLAAQTDTLIQSAEVHFDDKSGLEPVQLNKEQLEQYKNDKAFDYSQENDKQNWWQAFKRWIHYRWTSFWEGIFGNIHPGSWLSVVVEVLKYVILAGIIVFFIGLFIRLNPGKALVTPTEKPAVFLSEEERIIREKDIPQLIDKAMAEQDYRKAVRYYYLWILKNLKEKKLIAYQHDKTNQEYRKEIGDPVLAVRFKKITRLYDFIWYGNFSINKEQYQQIHNEFKRMENQLNQRENV